jgi:O-antigen/teichoic acid export membrane protein
MNYLNKNFIINISNKATGIWRHDGFQKYFRNTGWMLAARIITFITSFLTIAIVARYLGPENLGKLDYAQSFVAILSVFASLGIDQILYRDLISHPEDENRLLGTAIYSKLFFGTLSFMVSILISILLKSDPILTILIGICALTFVVSPIGTVGSLFKAQVKAKYTSQISIFLAFFIPILKLMVIFFDKGIIYFAVIILIESLISVLWSLYIYKFHLGHNPFSWKFHLDTFKKLMKDSWPLLLAGVSGYIYAKMDQVLLLHYIDSATVGIYGVAVRLTQVWAFLPGLIIGSLFPAIINAKKIDLLSYSKRFKMLAILTTGVTAVIAIPLYIFAPFVIKLIFGTDFIAAAPILRIHLWISIAITLVILAQHYLIAENYSKIFLYTSLIGATTNIILNIILIPLFNSQGAAWGTMLSYLAVVISLFMFKKSRRGIMMIMKTK